MTQAVDDADRQVWCGIDLGTTMTKFALMFAGDAEPSLRPFEHGGKKMESVVFVHRDETQWSCPGEMNIDHMIMPQQMRLREQKVSSRGRTRAWLDTERARGDK
jgi:hypothetical protein